MEKTGTDVAGGEGKTGTPKSPTRKVALSDPAKGEKVVKLQKLSTGLRRFFLELPERDWFRIKAFVPESDEEGQLLETIPLVRIAMGTCPSKVLGRLMKGQVREGVMDEAYRKLHEALHAPRQAVLHIFELAGMSPDQPLEDSNDTKSGNRKPKEPAAGPPSPPASPLRTEPSLSGRT